MKFTIPPRLKKGDKVAIVTPSFAAPYLFPEVYELGLERVRTVFGLEPIAFPSTCKSPEYLSKNPQARADDINAAFADTSIKAIISTTGGNDCIRILPYLNAKLIAANPKIFLGYSDTTNVHLFLWKLGLISYYGGSVMSQFGMQGAMQDYTIEWIKNALFETELRQVTISPTWTDIDFDWADASMLTKHRPMESTPELEWYNCGNVSISGKLWGGCLEVLDLQLAVNNPQYLPALEEFNNIVLYIETSEELPSEGFVYRFIAALAERTILQRIGGLLVGLPKTRFLQNVPPGGSELFRATQQQAIKQALSDYGCTVPVVFNFNFGHTDPQMLIPNGGTVYIDDRQKIITLSYE
ncbi:MAG: S66 peptidase family protein [Candidatus Babeliales bacterium]